MKLAIDSPLHVPGLRPVLLAQFFSAFADNALLFATLALLKNAAYPEWSQPILQMVFVLAYILLAPFVGHIADRFSKGRVMMVANGIKLIGVIAIGVNISPFLGYSLVGIGAAAYSPAKYGILGELLPLEQLVKGNGLMEGSTIAAILLGSVSGGVLADWHVSTALLVCAIIYALAVMANVMIPKLAAARPHANNHPKQLLQHFIHASQTLWQDKQCRFSLIGTSMFWGAGVTLRFLLVIWVPIALGIQDNTTPTTLNAMVALGIVVGAFIAAKWVSIQHAGRALPAGIAVGLLVTVFALETHLLPAYGLLVLVGVCGGFFVVPLNALLQERGQKTVGTGSAIAVQNLAENGMMLSMLVLYSAAIWLGASAVITGVAFGILFALAITCLWIWQLQRKV
ncbi:lysophospholipid transporter LplT [Rosenbergiella australiborealis]|uniref:Lysophospholipid transporter LplT n=1 Tax=Rosenbergiella australiborealis TaxID=1544696 RepID=A0ABS5T7K8_9GAMM|nr:lysophospholipid transporter LplT [Rosenbergiella australiborealis]MBT0728341.1 lysophospholipid transporter LplT [Rosenbergiella australiborealis]